MSSRPLPPGQALTRKFPVVGERLPSPEAPPPVRWRLDVAGLVARPLAFARDDFLALPRRDRVADLHCVTGWSRLDTRLHGLPLAELLQPAGIAPAARFVRFVAASERGHDTSLPLEVALADTWVVDSIDGQPLEPEHGGPLRTVTPSRYFYKSLKWLRRVELLAEDRLGYWERESDYHNVGDPWAGDQRFTSGSIDPAELERFRRATDFARWQLPRRVLRGLDLRGWQPLSPALAGLQLKNCDLREARLAGCDLAGANLSLSDLRRADLRGAILRCADLEGADLSGADLTGADLSATALSATRFVGQDDHGARLEAVVEGMRLEGATGLLEDQEAFLRSRAAL